jgi:ATP-binding cassette, subfamily G (WHITE), member 2, PDR
MITSLMFSLTLIFAGVFQPLSGLIPFWHWMLHPPYLAYARYYVSPLQYMVGATVSNALHGINVTCTPEELSIIQPPNGKPIIAASDK